MVRDTILAGSSLRQSSAGETAVISDEQLALGVQQGRVDALTRLVERYHDPIFAYLYRFTGGNRPLAEDLVQETFLRVMQRIGQYRHPRPFKPWCYAIATNLARDHVKSADRRLTDSAVPAQMAALPTGQPSPGAIVQQRDEAAQIAAALFKLPPAHREAIILRYYQDLSHREMAAILDVPIGTVKSRLSNGLQQLKAALAEELT